MHALNINFRMPETLLGRAAMLAVGLGLIVLAFTFFLVFLTIAGSMVAIALVRAALTRKAQPMGSPDIIEGECTRVDDCSRRSLDDRR